VKVNTPFIARDVECKVNINETSCKPAQPCVHYICRDNNGNRRSEAEIIVVSTKCIVKCAERIKQIYHCFQFILNSNFFLFEI